MRIHPRGSPKDMPITKKLGMKKFQLEIVQNINYIGSYLSHELWLACLLTVESINRFSFI